MVHCGLEVAADWELAIDLAAPIGIGGFADDMEAGEGTWTHAIVTPSFTDQWHLSSQRNHTAGGSHSWKFGDTGAGDYANLADGALETEAIEIADTDHNGLAVM